MKRLVVILFVVVAMSLVGATAQAGGDLCEFNVSSGVWTDDGNWSCGHEPTFEDHAVILTGNTCTMNDSAGEADYLTVESTATLNIQANRKLRLDDTGGNGTTIAGTVNLQGANSELSFEATDQDIDGAGKIVGAHNGARISITFGEKLTNFTTIEGKLSISGDGVFVNRGTVHANVAGTLLIDCDSFDDSFGGVWKISTSSSAVLKIAVTDTTIVAMVGDWTIEDDGRLNVDSAGFTTNGSLLWTGGTIDVASGKIVKFGTN